MRKNTCLSLFLSLAMLVFMNACESPSGQNQPTSTAETQEAPEYAIVIHGGAGTITKANMTPEKEAAYNQALNEALDIGEEVLKNGGSALEAVEKTIMYLEDNPLFNAGKGAVLTNAETCELDASIMDGSDQNAGAVAGVKYVKNPIRAAIAVMKNSPHVMMAGTGADQFALEQGLDTVPNEYFYTERRLEAIRKAKAREEKTGMIGQRHDEKYGTVGCVALDKNGNLAAGTSTGGMTNKRWGRIGDSPIIGAGTYADNATCGVSCTGHGEYFIRYTVAADVAHRMAYLGESVEEAANFVINKKLVEKGGSGGLIAMDAKGNVAMPFNTEGMYRGYARPGERVVKIYGE
ncbi:MAG: beta-aspartyl-peptidase [Saprospirales bacterium]|nr:beta-aspartyl-peptidase [Saprospirales bacterium]